MARWSASKASSAVRRGLSRYPRTRGQADAAVLVGRERVRLLLVAELQTVLDRAEERVRVAEAVGVGRSTYPPSRAVERVERGGRTDALVVAAVHELEELHRELDVADAAATTLELAIREALALGIPRPAPSSPAPRGSASGSSRSGHTRGVSGR